MPLPEDTTCRRCGAPPEPGAPMGLCSRCLTAALLDEFVEPDSENESDRGAATGTKYELGGEIARGGMGSILRAKDRSLDRTVAMKVMLPERDAGAEARRRFTREALALARLEHPNIVPIHELGRDEDGRPYYTMKLLQGETLQAILQRLADRDATTLREYTLDRLLSIFRKVCDGIAFAHAHGVIHRDLKPENIMVGNFGEALIMDWGLAKLTTPSGATTLPVASPWEDPDEGPPIFPAWEHEAVRDALADVTLQGSVIGTPRYMSPEQARGLVDRLDHRSDIFSLGAILYAVLTLSPPVQGDNLDEVLHKIATAAITPPSAVAADGTGGGATGTAPVAGRSGLPHCPGGKAPEALSAVTMKALARRPQDRYQRVEELAGDVEAFQGGFATSVEDPGLARQLGLLIRRHRREFSIAFAAWFAITALAVWFVIRLKISEREAELNAEEAGRNAQRAEAETRRADAARQAAQDALGLGRLALAESAYGDRDTRGVIEQLRQVPDKLRNSNWHYLLREADTSIASHSFTEFMDAAPHPARPGIFAIVGRNRRVNLLEARTGSKRLEFRVGFAEKQKEGFYCLALSPDGSRIAVGRPMNNIAIHDGRSGRFLAEWPATGSNRLEYSPDGTRLLQTNKRRTWIRLWDAENGNTLWDRRIGNNAIAGFCNGGREVLSCANVEGLVRRGVDDGRIIARIEGDWRKAATLAVHPEGQEALIGRRDGAVVRLNLIDNTVVWIRYLNDEAIADLTYSPDGDRFISAVEQVDGSQSLHIWDLRSGSEDRTLLGGRSAVARLAVHPRSNELLVAGPLSRVWDVGAAEPRWSRPVSVTRDGLCDAQFWGTDDRLLTSDERFGTVLVELPGQKESALQPHAYRCRASVSRDGKTTVFLIGASSAEVRDHEGRTSTFDLGLAMEGADLRVSPQGRRVAFFQSQKLAAFDLPSGRGLFHLSKGGVASCNDLAWLGEERLVGALTMNSRRGSSFSQEWLAVIDATDGKHALTITNTTGINCLAVSSDFRLIAEAGEDRMIRLRDSSNLDVKREFRAHDDSITRLAFHPQKPLLASGAKDGSVKVWDLEAGHCLTTFRGLAETALNLDFSPTGRRLACVAENQGVLIWEIPETPEPDSKIGANEWVNLLDRIMPDTHLGNWRFQNRMLVSPDRPAAIVSLPGKLPPAGYLARVDLRPLGQDLLHFTLPIGDRLTGFDLDANTLEGRFGGVIRAIAKQPSRRVNKKEIGDPSRRELHLDIRTYGDQVRFESMLDGMPFCRWNGPLSALKWDQNWPTTPAGRIAIGAHKPTWVVYSVDVRSLPSAPVE